MANSYEYSTDQSKLFSTSIYIQEEQREEQEVSAFTFAVTQLLGPEQARLSEKIWFDELDLMDSPPIPTDRNLRAVTIAASFRVANEMDVQLLSCLP